MGKKRGSVEKKEETKKMKRRRVVFIEVKRGGHKGVLRAPLRPALAYHRVCRPRLREPGDTHCACRPLADAMALWERLGVCRKNQETLILFKIDATPRERAETRPG